jgi:hypothetical protein
MYAVPVKHEQQPLPAAWLAHRLAHGSPGTARPAKRIKTEYSTQACPCAVPVEHEQQPLPAAWLVLI